MRLAAGITLVAISALSCAESGLARPYNLTADYVGGAVELRWECAPGPAGFLVQRSDGTDYNYRTLGWSENGRKYYLDETVGYQQWYFYRVAAGYEPSKEMSDYCPEAAVYTE